MHVGTIITSEVSRILGYPFCRDATKHKPKCSDLSEYMLPINERQIKTTLVNMLNAMEVVVFTLFRSTDISFLSYLGGL